MNVQVRKGKIVNSIEYMLKGNTNRKPGFVYFRRIPGIGGRESILSRLLINNGCFFNKVLQPCQLYIGSCCDRCDPDNPKPLVLFEILLRVNERGYIS